MAKPFEFNRYPDLEGKHAFLSASKYHWIRYTPEKLLEKWDNHMTAAHGTRLHAFAKECILLGQKLPNTNQTLNLYVNDCIGHRMIPEQMLFVSPNAFGTADAIKFEVLENGTKVLRIFDLKNGVTIASIDQLLVYAAFFCLEYNKIKPLSIEYDLRIYQNDEILYAEVDPSDVAIIMDRIKEFDKLIEQAKEV